MGTKFVDRSEFEDVYELHKNIVFQTAYLYTKEWHTAEDITQEAFFRYYVYAGHTKVDNPKSWLLTTAKNMSLNHIRDSRKTSLVALDEVGERQIGSQEDGESILFRNLWKREVYLAANAVLEALHQRNRRWYHAVILAYAMEKPQSEVAECMGIKAETLYSMLYRAKNWIKKNYREEYDRIYRA